jgi:ABC-type sugar transport system substrate-binding protein
MSSTFFGAFTVGLLGVTSYAPRASDDVATTEAEASGDTSGETGDFVIGIAALGLQFPFSAAMSRGFHETGDELGVEVIELDAEADTERQVANVQDLITQEVDGIILVPINGEAAQTIVDDIEAADIPVLAAATAVGEPGLDVRDVYPGLDALVIQDEPETGRIIAQEVVRLLPDGGRVAIVEGAAGFNEVVWRSEGFEEVLDEAGGFEIVARQPGDWDPAKGEAACQNMLQADPDIDLFYAQEDLMGQGCKRAVDAAGSDAIVVSNSGGTESGLEAVRDGTIAATLCFRPATMASVAMELMVERLQTGELEENFYTYETPLITTDNVDECPSEW